MTIASLSLVSDLERMAAALESHASPAGQVSSAGIAERIARHIGAKNDEVALMALSTRWRHLHFLVSESLKQVGFIPLSSTTAIAAKTARESRPEIINNLAAVRHASVFEGVKIGGETSEIIQKTISAPILSGEKVIGVIQVSRKGRDPKAAGPDFTADDLGRILALCKPLGNSSTTSRANSDRVSFTRCSFAAQLSAFEPQIALTLLHLLVTFPQQKIFSTYSTHGGTITRHHGVRR